MCLAFSIVSGIYSTSTRRDGLPWSSGCHDHASRVRHVRGRSEKGRETGRLRCLFHSPVAFGPYECTSLDLIRCCAFLLTATLLGCLNKHIRLFWRLYPHESRPRSFLVPISSSCCGALFLYRNIVQSCSTTRPLSATFGDRSQPLPGRKETQEVSIEAYLFRSAQVSSSPSAVSIYMRVWAASIA